MLLPCVCRSTPSLPLCAVEWFKNPVYTVISAAGQVPRLPSFSNEPVNRRFNGKACQVAFPPFIAPRSFVQTPYGVKSIVENFAGLTIACETVAFGASCSLVRLCVRRPSNAGLSPARRRTLRLPSMLVLICDEFRQAVLGVHDFVNHGLNGQHVVGQVPQRLLHLQWHVQVQLSRERRSPMH